MTPKILLIGYGNPGRLDDGLGPALAEELEKMNLSDLTIDSNYLLTVEDAETIAKHDVVVFADACLEAKEPFDFYEIAPKATASFTTHSIAPEAVLKIAYDLFGAQTKAYILGIRGYAFNEFGERLSEKAQDNLSQAVTFVCSRLREWGLTAP